ncbi:hypothetical protein KR032_001316 [Drosophila birchii]|nr:hypothetical protein KR032_001316 [Drosophila birchii]
MATKSELAEYAEEAENLEDLSKELSAFCKNTDHTESIRLRLATLAERYRKEKSPARTPTIVVTGEMESPRKEKPGRKVETEIIDRVRGWGIRYQGTSNPLEFLQKIEQWAKGYGMAVDQLIQTMPFILEGLAADWWSTTPTEIRTWDQLKEELREYFLPPRYEEQLKQQIAQMRQRENEPVREYAIELRKLMRFTKLSEGEKLDRVYKNCRSKIKLYTRRNGFSTLTEFLKLAEEV